MSTFYAFSCPLFLGLFPINYTSTPPRCCVSFLYGPYDAFLPLWNAVLPFYKPPFVRHRCKSHPRILPDWLFLKGQRPLSSHVEKTLSAFTRFLRSFLICVNWILSYTFIQIAPLLFDTIVTFMTVWKAFNIRRRNGGPNSRLIQTFLREGS